MVRALGEEPSDGTEGGRGERSSQGRGRREPDPAGASIRTSPRSDGVFEWTGKGGTGHDLPLEQH